MSDRSNGSSAGQPEKKQTPPPADEPPVVCTCSKDTCAAPKPRADGGRGRGGRSRCCCEDRCTCPRTSSWPRRTHSHCHHHRGDQQSRHCDPAAAASGEEGRWSPNRRRCPYCVPERALCEEANLLKRQQRCQSARAEQRRRYNSLWAQREREQGCGSYRTNTADLLRSSRGSDYQRAADAEYRSRREELRAELAARRDEIAQLRRQRETLQSAAGGHWSRGCPHHRSGPNRSLSPRGPCAGKKPPPFRGHGPHALSGRCACRSNCRCGSSSSSSSSSSSGARRHSRGRPCSPPRPPSPHGWGGKMMHPPPHGHGPWGCPPRGHCPPDVHCKATPPPPPPPPPPMPRPHWGCSGHSDDCGPKRRPPPPPAQCWGHGKRPPHSWSGKKMPPPHGHAPWGCPPPCHCPPHAHCKASLPHPWHGMPPSRPRPWDRPDEGAASPPPHCHSPHHQHHPPCPPCAGAPKFPPPPHCGGAHHGTPWWRKRHCPSCGHPLLHADAADVVAMLANKNYDKLSKCPACGFVAGAPHGQEKGKVEHCSHPSEQKGPEGHAAVRAASANGTTARPGPAAPKYGRKVFITDDEYLDRRASRMAAWEKAGAIQREPISNRSPSAPLPDKAPKWRTVDSARSLNAENGSD